MARYAVLVGIDFAGGRRVEAGEIHDDLDAAIERAPWVEELGYVEKIEDAEPPDSTPDPAPDPALQVPDRSVAPAVVGGE